MYEPDLLALYFLKINAKCVHLSFFLVFVGHVVDDEVADIGEVVAASSR